MGGEYPVTVAGPAGLFHCSHSYWLTINCLLLSDAPNTAQRQICALTQKVSYSESRCGTAKEAHVMLAFVQLLPIESTQHPKSHFLALRKHLQDFFFFWSHMPKSYYSCYLVSQQFVTFVSCVQQCNLQEFLCLL